MPGIARWIGFLVAGYATVANDSIQTIGTFIASNRQKPVVIVVIYWWHFVATMTYSWVTYGDVSYGRLASKGFSETPMSFSFLQVAAPIFLLILTFKNAGIDYIFNIDGVFNQCIECRQGFNEKFNRLWLGLYNCYYYLVSPFALEPHFASGSMVNNRDPLVGVVNAGCRQYCCYYQLSGIEFLCFIPITCGLGFMLYKGGLKSTSG